MIEVMVIVRDTTTQKREFHVTQVLGEAAVLDDVTIAELRDEAGTAVTAAARRLRELAGLTNYYSHLEF